MDAKRINENELLAEKIERIKKLSHLLDDQFRIPGTKVGFGYDSILGLLPVVGDTISLGISGYIILLSKRCGVKKRVLFQMLSNVGYDYLIGLIPFVGDLFDVASKANLKNAQLLVSLLEEQYAQSL